jgi:hypothetical protein
LAKPPPPPVIWQRPRFPFVWLSLDESDNEPVRFWRYVLAFLRAIGNFGKDFWEIPVRQELIISNILADMVLDKLYTLPGTTVMVLDDYHLIHNEMIQSSLAYFIKYLPLHFRMMILSRTEPEFKFIRAYAGGQVLKLDVRDLSFDYGETTAFFKTKGFQLTDAALTAIRDYTEGWVAGLVVTALNLDRLGVFDSLSCSREYEHLVYTRYLNLIGRYDEALLLLNRLSNFAQKEERLGSRIEILGQIAISHQLKGDLNNAMTALDAALELGMEEDYIRTFVDQMEPMAELLAKYQIWRKQPEKDAKYQYAKNLLRVTRENNRMIREKLPAAHHPPLPEDYAFSRLSVKE